jgi:hypothetical protein
MSDSRPAVDREAFDRAPLAPQEDASRIIRALITDGWNIAEETR